jgi:hypothetical protein
MISPRSACGRTVLMLLILIGLPAFAIALPIGDTDGDGVPDVNDCHPLDPSVWTPPGEATGLSVAGGASASFTWSAPPDGGGSQTVLYDLIRSGSPSDFASATCVVSSATGTTASDPEIPGSVFYYLVRAKNGCGGGLGTGSNGAPRSGVSCVQPSGSACAGAGECAGGGCCGGVCTDLSADAGNCGVCSNTCDDANACTVDACSGVATGCRHVDVNACASPACSLGACALDTDGDGLSDAWERNGYVDLNCNGVYDGPTVDVPLPGADPNAPDVFVWYDWMDYGLDDESCASDVDCSPGLGLGHLGETCSAQSQCRYACSTDSDCAARWPTESHAGERCVGNACQHTHDPLVLDADAFEPVTEQFAAHGIHLHLRRGNARPHSHVASLRNDAQMSVTCEGASGTNVGVGRYSVSLYDLKSIPNALLGIYHYALFAHYSGCDSPAHCPINAGTASDCPDPTLAYGQAGLAEISGNDLIVSMGGLVNNTGLSPRFEAPDAFMHELGHNLGLRHDGHIDTPCTVTSDCRPGDTCAQLADGQGRVCHETIGGVLGAEEPNYKPNYISIMNYMYESSFIRMGAGVGSRRPLACAANSDCAEPGAFCVLNDADSHCSVTGRVCTGNINCIAAGDICVSPPVPSNTCSTTGYVCVTASDCAAGEACVPPDGPGYCARLDYSRQTLPTAGATPGALDESHLDDAVGLGSGTSDLFTYTDALCHSCQLRAPTSGAVDWAGNGLYTDALCNVHLIGLESFTDTGVRADVDSPDGNCAAPIDVLHGYTDWPDLSGIPFNYKFMCTPNGQN